jgi:TonB-dependent receptor
VLDPADENAVTYSVNPANYKKPSRFFRNMDEYTSDNKLHFSLPIQLAGRESKIKFGGSYLFKSRTFRERRLDYEGTERFVSATGLMDIFAADHLGIVGTDPNGSPVMGIYLLDATERRNQYDGSQTVGAGYAMADLQFGPRVKLNLGLRAEFTRMDVASFSTGIRPGNIEQLDFLPALNWVYEPIPDMNVRISYSRTVARPNFREMAPFASFDFNQDNVVVGNPNLRRVLSDNADIRWEYFFRPGEMVSVSGFFKQLQNPIERIFSPVGFNEVTWRNVPNGTVFGFELEVRKRLDFVPFLSDFSVGANIAFIRSQVDIDPAELARFRAVLGPDYPTSRRLFAQSPYLINAYLGYANIVSGTEANLSFNLFGERLSVVGTGTAPDVYEQPRPVLNFMLSQQIGSAKRFKITVRANNLLDPEYLFAYRTDGPRTDFQSFRLGREFQLGFSYSIK